MINESEILKSILMQACTHLTKRQMECVVVPTCCRKRKNLLEWYSREVKENTSEMERLLFEGRISEDYFITLKALKKELERIS